VDIAEELFDTDDEGYAHVVGDGVLAPDQINRAELAEANCPERAIRIVDAERSDPR
jgi:ferredoxin